MKRKFLTLFLALAASVGTMFATTKSMTPGIAHLSWDKNNNQWGITAYDDGDNPQFVFGFAIDGDKTTLPTSMTLSNNTDDTFVFSDMKNGSALLVATVSNSSSSHSKENSGYV